LSFVVEALAEGHDRSRFDCCSDPLDRYIRQQASQDARRKIARVFVAVPEGGSEIAGFYTLSAASIERARLLPEAAKRLPHYPVPVALIGRLAVGRRWAGRGLGKALLADALQRVLRASESIAMYAVLVEAKDERARRFYERFGFIPLPGSSRRLFFPLARIGEAMSG
jgi:GNAT superfamily N-acetyltransferase